MTRSAVVTGGTGGIGFHVAQQLHLHGIPVTVIGRDPGRGADAMRKIGGGTRFLPPDLSSLEQVLEVGAVLAAEGPLQLLVNNVGGMWSTRWETADGIEAGFALNHLAPVVLTEALLGALRAGAPSRIVEVTSSSITTAVLGGAPTYDEVEQGGEYVHMAVTGRAKLAGKRSRHASTRPHGRAMQAQHHERGPGEQQADPPIPTRCSG